MRIATVFLVIFIALVIVELSEAARGGGRGGGRGGSRGSSGRKGSSSKSGKSSTPKITKYTPIKPTSVRTSVIRSQTNVGSRSSAFNRVVVGYLVYRYAFSSAPVYRHGYPMYRSYVSIPKDRAVRVSYEEEKLLDDNGKLCLGESAEKRTLVEGIDRSLVELNTTVKYSNGTTLELRGLNSTVSLEDINDQNFEVTSRGRYNVTIVTATNCTQVEKTVRGTMITMYETNPNGASLPNINSKLLPAVISLFAFINVFIY